MTDETPSVTTDPAWRRPRGVYPGWQIAAAFLLGWALILAGVLGVLYTPVSAWRTQAFLRHAVHARLPIVAFRTYPPSHRQPHETYRPIIEIVGAQGGTVQSPVGAAAYPSPYRLGDKIGVLYAAGTPALAVRDTIEDVWGDTLAIVIGAAFTLLLGFGTLLWMRYFVSHPPEQLEWIDRWFLPLKLLTRQ